MLDIEKIMLVIEHIENHITEKLDLYAIAKAAQFSQYHLHRSFSQTTGLTIHDYLRRRQLTEAAKLLLSSGKPIIDIALLSGYESQQAFTRIFKALYKYTPNAFRRNQLFYPLQLRFEFKGNFSMSAGENQDTRWDISFAKEDDIPKWMELVRLVIDGFPFLDEEEHIEALKKSIKKKEALIAKDSNIAAGIMIFSYNSGSIDFLGVHPLYRKWGITKILLNKVMYELLTGKDEISITTYREGDKADTGYRKEIQKLGFTEAELLVEFGYPTQRFFLKKGQPKKGEINNG